MSQFSSNRHRQFIKENTLKRELHTPGIPRMEFTL